MLHPGATVGAYRIESKLGEGGMGMVFRATHLPTGAPRAIKVLLGARPRTVARFKREAESAAALSHPGIVRIHELIDGREPLMVQELVEGRDLEDWLASGVDPLIACRWLVAVCEAVGHAHARGIIHRDLKPGNIVIDARGQPKVMDFGLALDMGRMTRLTRTGTMLGTPHYMAPEQLLGRAKEADLRADVYALGVILFEILTGRRPFEGRSLIELQRQICEQPPPSPSEVARAPVAFDAICTRALAKEPAGRYQSTAALAADLRAALGEAPALSRAGRQDLRVILTGLLVAALGLGIILGIRAWRQPAPASLPTGSAGTQGVSGVTGGAGDDPSPRAAGPGVGLLPEVAGSQGMDPAREEIVVRADWKSGLPDPIVALIDRAAALLDGGEPQQALQVLTAALLEFPDCGDLYLERARVHGYLNDLTRSSRDIDAALSASQPAAPLHLLRTTAEFQQRTGNYTGMLETTEQALERAPRDDTWRFLRGLALLGLLRPDEALADLGFAARADPENGVAHFYYGESLRGVGRNEEAIAEYDATLEQLGDRIQLAWFWRGQLHIKQGRLERGVADLDRLLALQPGASFAQLLRGQTRLELGDARGALTDCDAVIARGDYPINARVQRGRACLRLGRTEDAQAELAWLQGVGDAAADPRVLGLAGLLALVAGDREEAIRLLEQAVAHRLELSEEPFETEWLIVALTRVRGAR